MSIKFLSIAFFLLFSSTASFAQKLVPFEERELMGYKDTRGHILIPARFITAQDFSKKGIAAVIDDQGWAFIDRRGRVIIRTPFIFDNGPDYFSEGLARFTIDNKFGFFNEYGKVAVAPRFDFALPFHEGIAAVCLECRKTQPDNDDHYTIVGGRWGLINLSGAVIIPLKFKNAENFHNGQARVTVNNRQTYIDRRGRIL